MWIVPTSSRTIIYSCFFNELNEFKEELYSGFIEGIDNYNSVNLQFHNYNRDVFDQLLSQARGASILTYIVMTGQFLGTEDLSTRWEDAVRGICLTITTGSFSASILPLHRTSKLIPTMHLFPAFPILVSTSVS